ncbi:WXG100 family type VII secretion target [Herpetosiphon llansteffanensis]|uniref:WXG100 family type VII secretion target n=1 Tax=Herpetosiphon llansteffanensis TaxID=2094568 RepID=UPI000D7BF0EA|nr:WXG100 family type VII secretion target [Herpetosiphon llansteffanensis]
MAADIIANKYEVVEQAGARFQKLHDQQAQMEAMVRRTYEQLRSGAWQGAAATAFFAEMTDNVFPALKRLQQTLIVGSEMATQINQIFRQAEEAAAKYMTFDGGSIGAMLADAGLAAKHGLASVSIGAALSDDSSKPDLRKTIFNDDYMDRLVGTKMQGMDDPALNKAMETLLNDNISQAEKDAALAQIAKSRGIPLEKIQADYDKFVDLRKKAEANGAANGKSAVDALDLKRHPNFLGSTSSLRYGKVISDALGVDPVFGSLLNPTGGLVGWGNYAIDAGERPVGYHGIMHDAGGYLFNYQNMGPGYDYLNSEGRNRGDPLTGQESGIRYWNEKFAKLNEGMSPRDLEHQNRINRLSELAGEGMGEFVDLKKTVNDGVNAVKDAASDGWNAAKDAANDGWNAAKDAASDVKDAANDGWNAAKDAANDGWNATKDGFNNVKDAASEQWNVASRKAKNLFSF